MKKTGNYKHGYTGKHIHRTWLSMKRRCDNPNAANYYLYGARGIKYDKRWINFENFLEDMGERPTVNHSLDRIDNSKEYSKDNCRWATALEQANNKRNNRFIEYNNEKKTLSQWARVAEISTGTLFARLNVQGWSMEKAMNTKAIKGRNQYGLK